MCSSSAAHTLDTHRIMHAFLALVIALAAAAAPALAAPAPARIGYEREIDSPRFNLVPELQNPYVLSMDYLSSQKNRAKLITRPRPDDFVVDDNLIVESNPLSIVRTAREKTANSQVSDALVRQRRGYNLENVRVPARYPYLPVPNYNRFRRWG